MYKNPVKDTFDKKKNMQLDFGDFGDSILFEILSYVPAADHWLLRTVSTRFRSVIPPNVDLVARHRTLDVVLARAISEGGLATVKKLIKKPSGEWIDAVRISASKGYIDITKFIVENRIFYDDAMSISSALTHGHVDIAEFLWERREQKIDVEILLSAAAKSASILALEWIVSKLMKFEVSVVLSRDFAMTRMIMNASIAGDLKCLEFVCGLTTREVLNDAIRRIKILHPFILLSQDVDCLRFLHDKFGYLPGPESVRSAVVTNNHRVLEYLLELGFIEEMRRVPVHMSPDMHTFLRSKGYQIQSTVDLNLHVSSLLTLAQTKNLMLLNPDPLEWIETLSRARLEELLGVTSLQELLCDFFRGHRMDFEILSVARKDTFEALQEMGGRCGWVVFLSSVCHSKDVEHIRRVWIAMDENDRTTFLSRVANLVLANFLPDNIDVLKFLVNIGVSLNGRRLRVSSRHTYTLELVEFAMENNVETHMSAMYQAAMYGHLDIMEYVAPRCTLDELRDVLSSTNLTRSHDDDEIALFLRKTILERTHFVLRWFLKLAGLCFRLKAHIAN